MKKTFKIERILSNTGILFHCSNTRDLKLERTTEEDLRYHLYVTSDEKIKHGDWYIGVTGKVHQCQEEHGDVDKLINAINKSTPGKIRKIVATTDTSLDVAPQNPNGIRYILPQLPESFIQAYIKVYNENKPITEVDLELNSEYVFIKATQFKPSEPGPVTLPKELKYVLKTRDDNTVIVHQSKMYSRDEVRVIAMNYAAFMVEKKPPYSSKETNDWFNENL